MGGNGSHAPLGVSRTFTTGLELIVMRLIASSWAPGPVPLQKVPHGLRRVAVEPAAPVAWQ